MARAALFKPYLKGCGYEDDLVQENVLFGGVTGDGKADLVAFAQKPFDARSACVAVLDTKKDPGNAVLQCRDLGAPVFFVFHGDNVQWWKQGETGPECLNPRIPPNELPRFFDEYKSRLHPASVYRAKTRGRFDKECQLSFVDVGLMPVVETEMGERLGDLIGRVVADLRADMESVGITNQVSDWFLTSVFWLVAAKILRDKHVPKFSDLDLRNVDLVFERVSKHYGAQTQIFVANQPYRIALMRAADTVAKFSNLGQVTTETLAFINENTMVTKATRKDLGTHSTPSYLVDYIVGRLSNWIGLIPDEQRHVFEPACGHAAFLVSVLRLLRELMPAEHPNPHDYLRDHLHGIEIDKGAREMARICLTLADIPNSDGWDLKDGSMFDDSLIEELADQATIFLANPPFERFSSGQRDEHKRPTRPCHFSKTTELFARALPKLRPGSVFGLIMAQNLLHEKDAAPLREFLLRECEIAEIILFPDGIFSFSDSESAVFIGRRLQPGAKPGNILYKQVRERDVEEFKLTYKCTTEREIPQDRFLHTPRYVLRAPDLEDVWIELKAARLDEIADVGKGLEYEGEHLPPGQKTYDEKPFPGAVPGFYNVGRDLQLHRTPAEVYMRTDSVVVRRKGTGTTIDIPQVLVNYHPVSREPWKLKAVLDQKGHAVSTSFLTVRPRPGVPIEYLWALCNSPVANAYVHTHATKRDIKPEVMRAMPVPRAQTNDMAQIAEDVRDYLKAAQSFDAGEPVSEDRLRQFLQRVDAAVLRLYALSSEQEHDLLSIFNDYSRTGVPFEYPEDFAQAQRSARLLELARPYPGEFVVLVGFEVVHHSRSRTDATSAYEAALRGENMGLPVFISPNRPQPQSPPQLRGRTFKRS